MYDFEKLTERCRKHAETSKNHLAIDKPLFDALLSSVAARGLDADSVNKARRMKRVKLAGVVLVPIEIYGQDYSGTHYYAKF